MKLNYILTIAGVCGMASMANAAITVTASNATYIRSNDANTNFQTSTTNVANDNGSNHRIAFYTFDFSGLGGVATSATLNLTENAGDGADEYEIFGIADGAVNLSTITWNSANTDGLVAANRPVGASLATFNSQGGSASYALTLDASFFAGDSDQMVTLAIVDNSSSVDGIGWTDGATLEVVPEPSSTALLGLGGIALLLRRRK